MVVSLAVCNAVKSGGVGRRLRQAPGPDGIRTHPVKDAAALLKDTQELENAIFQST